MHVHFHVSLADELRQTLDAVTHQLATHMIGVIVGHQGRHQLEILFLDMGE